MQVHFAFDVYGTVVKGVCRICPVLGTTRPCKQHPCSTDLWDVLVRGFVSPASTFKRTSTPFASGTYVHAGVGQSSPAN